MPALHYDIFPIVLRFLRQDRNTLFSCILVNRTICRLAIPLLWKNPFTSNDSLEEINQYQSALLIRTYLACLTEDERRYLTNKGVEIRNFPKPLFDYACFLEEMMYSCPLYNSTLCWILLEYHKYTKDRLNGIRNMYQFDESEIQHPLINSLYSMLFKKSKIKTLGISIDMLKIKDPIDQQLFDNMNSSNLSNLSWLIIYLKDNSIGLEVNQHSFDFLLSIIKKWCHKIKHVRISNLLVFAHQNLPKIQEIISQQQRLVKLELLTPKQNVIINDILLNLKSHDFSFLSEMEIHDTDLSDNSLLEGLSSIDSLKSLYLLKCRGISMHNVHILSDSSISLQKLKFISNEFPPGLIISTIGKSLNELKTNQLDKEAAELISYNCSESLTNLEIVGVNLQTQKIFYDLIIRLKLNSLKISCCRESTGQILNDLGKNLPNSLKYLSLFGLYTFKGLTVEHFENLLSNCNASLESLEIDGNINRNFLVVIFDYIKNHRNFKSLIINLYGKGFEDSSLLNDISKYGVKSIVN
ncbi:4087_t:CDS:1 [Funneliformis geosporum]|uniref:10331_t:CDS:1 n=1 Tax=Funneliformis geosporum TaxID=1117311 RepID=A0A9W4SH03_9GLOM|nr:4087_t:CDS:1 [Funneliformis geosporum]CAI2168744.1 10331_t:CDS:1 [Funneliformis geosporum]